MSDVNTSPVTPSYFESYIQKLKDDDEKFGYGLDSSNSILFLDRYLEHSITRNIRDGENKDYSEKLKILFRRLNDSPSILMSVKYARRRYRQFHKDLVHRENVGGKDNG